ncbi:hypothetical protein [Desulfobacter curvatus]|uniref:hypothetical protein n=1 Tax=Desulfobacter curvatus TaxID=2290 RepID=UPI00037B0CB5|nr:hypothetical protein [Desulfobacter curvatus]
MKKIFKKSIIALMVVLFSATLAMAYSQNSNGKGTPQYTECDPTCPDSPCYQY